MRYSIVMGIYSKIVERLRAFAIAMLYCLCLYSALAFIAIFILNPVFSFIRLGVLHFAVEYGALKKWGAIVFACSFVTAMVAYLWTEWDIWREARGRK